MAHTLLRQKAVRQGFRVTPEEIEARRAQLWGTSSASVCGAGVQEMLGEELLVQRYCDFLTRHELRASRAEAQALYQQRREQFWVGEQVRLMQINHNIYLPGDEESARLAMQAAELELSKGASFQQVATRYSDCGGRIALGWVQRGEMIADFEEVAFGLARGQRSDIFRTVFGLHILLVSDKKDAGYQPFDEVRSSLAKQLLQMRKDRKINAEVAEAIRSATIAFAPASAAGGISESKRSSDAE